MTIIPNIAQLKLHVVTPGNNSVFVEGYTNRADAGGGIFIFTTFTDMGVTGLGDARCPIPDDGLFILSTASGMGNGLWIRNFEGDINIRYYGVMGNGVTDIAPVLQLAINYVADSYENITYRRYAYNRSNTIYLPNGKI